MATGFVLGPRFRPRSLARVAGGLHPAWTADERRPLRRAWALRGRLELQARGPEQVERHLHQGAERGREDPQGDLYSVNKTLLASI